MPKSIAAAKRIAAIYVNLGQVVKSFTEPTRGYSIEPQIACEIRSLSKERQETP
jgi:hypothetical protein